MNNRSHRQVDNRDAQLKLEVERRFMQVWKPEYKDMKMIYRKQFEQAVLGKSNVFFNDYVNVLQENFDKFKELAGYGLGRIHSMMTANHWKQVRYLTEENISPLYAMLLASFEDYVFLGIDITSGDNSFALYTRNLFFMEELERLGVLVFQPRKDRILSSLYGTKTNNGVLEAELPLIRLDVLEVRNGVPYFEARSPRSNLKLDDYYFIPTTSIYDLLELVARMTSGKPFRFTKETVHGEISHVATLDLKVVERVYSHVDDKSALQRKYESIRSHYDIATNRIRFYDLEAPVSELGIDTVRPEMLNSIRPVAYEDIDGSMHNLELNFSYPIYKTKIMQATVNQINTLGNILPDIMSYATLKDKQKALIEWGSKQYPTILYKTMQRNRQVFPDLNTLFEVRHKSAPRYLKNYQTLEIPTNISDEHLRRRVAHLLYNGVVRIGVLKKDGTTYQKIGTNNKKILRDLLGKDYLRVYESPRARLQELKEFIERKRITTKEQLMRGITAYDLGSYVMVDFIKRGIYEEDYEKHGLTKGVLTGKRINSKFELETYYTDLEGNEIVNPTPELIDALVSKHDEYRGTDAEIISRGYRAINMALDGLAGQLLEKENHRRVKGLGLTFRNPYTTTQDNYFQAIAVDKIITVEYTTME